MEPMTFYVALTILIFMTFALGIYIGLAVGNRRDTKARTIEMEHTENIADVIVAADKVVSETIPIEPYVTPSMKQLIQAVVRWRTTYQHVMNCEL